jgi:hypothetical protein
MNKVHVFEQANLGKAPFEVVDAYEHHEHQIGDSLGVTDMGTSCDYCSTYIRNVFVIESSDGKKFRVGSDCVNKTSDKGLTRVVNEFKSRKRREKREAEYAKVIEQNKNMKKNIERKYRLNVKSCELNMTECYQSLILCHIRMHISPVKVRH